MMVTLILPRSPTILTNPHVPDQPQPVIFRPRHRKNACLGRTIRLPRAGTRREHNTNSRRHRTVGGKETCVHSTDCGRGSGVRAVAAVDGCGGWRVGAIRRRELRIECSTVSKSAHSPAKSAFELRFKRRNFSAVEGNLENIFIYQSVTMFFGKQDFQHFFQKTPCIGSGSTIYCACGRENCRFSLVRWGVVPTRLHLFLIFFQFPPGREANHAFTLHRRLRDRQKSQRNLFRSRWRCRFRAADIPHY